MASNSGKAYQEGYAAGEKAGKLAAQSEIEAMARKIYILEQAINSWQDPEKLAMLQNIREGLGINRREK